MQDAAPLAIRGRGVAGEANQDRGGTGEDADERGGVGHAADDNGGIVAAAAAAAAEDGVLPGAGKLEVGAGAQGVAVNGQLRRPPVLF